MATELDAFLRHQAYLEGYKNGQTEETETAFEEIAAVIILLLNRLGVERLSDLTKRDLAKFVAEVNRKVAEIFNKNPGFTIDAIKEFMRTELQVYNGIYKALETPKPLPPFNGDRIVTEAVGAPVAGLGEGMAAIITGTLGSILADIRKQLHRGAADNLTIAEIARLIVGTRAVNFKDGLMPKMVRRYVSALETMIQHASAYLGHRLGAMVSDRYQWVSVLDSGTTDICRGRNGNVYEYATGPRPPAHYRCRSTTVPVLAPQPLAVPTYFGWIRQQPQAILVDLLGATRANGLQSGNLRADELGPFGGTRSLTLAQYRAALSRMIED